MNPKHLMAAAIAASSLAASALAAPSSVGDNGKTAESADSNKPTPPIFLVWRGAPKNISSGLVYVDASGRELSKSRSLAIEKAAKNIASAQPTKATKEGA